jgi:hypothetical protein
MTVQLNDAATAFTLLAAMRPHVEVILGKYQVVKEISNCPSQKLRAIQVVDYINRQLNEAIYPDRNAKMTMIKDRDRLQLFMAVHTTVTTLEWAERNYSFEF